MVEQKELSSLAMIRRGITYSAAAPWNIGNLKRSKEYYECNTVKSVLNGHSKIDKSKVLKTNGSLMKVESIVECSLGLALSDNRS